MPEKPWHGGPPVTRSTVSFLKSLPNSSLSFEKRFEKYFLSLITSFISWE
tara:strand:+ start:52 stop:201 length:150 start_codon:yes stop_codon:yes gene_type:complete